MHGAPRPGVRAVLWDYDGTLVDTRGLDERSIRALVAAEPALAGGAAAFWATDGRPLRERLEHAWPGRATALLRHFDSAGPPIVSPEVVVALERLRERGVPTAVVSSRREDALRRGLEASGLGALLGPVVVGLESVRAAKPDPEGLLLAASRLGVDPAAAAYVGDRPSDMEAARLAGMAPWLAAWGHAEPVHLPPWAERLSRPAEVVARVVAPGPGARGATLR